MSTNRFIVLICFILSAQSAFSQKTDSLDTKPKRIKILPFPTLGSEPETKFHFGAVSLFIINLFQDSLTRVSNAKVEFNYTLRNQIILESQWNYFFKEEKWFSDGVIHISKYPDFYYGIGSNASEEDKVLYESNRMIFDVGLYRRMKDQLFLGGEIKYVKYNNISTADINPYPELKDSRNIGLSSSLFHDSRNNLLNTTKGALLKLNIGYNWGTNNYLNAKIDLRKYVTFKNDFVLASRVYNSFIFNTPNFYDYSILGGDEYVRGYFYGKFRDNNLSTIQTEVRTPLIWRLGLAFITGISSIYQDTNITDDIKPNYGIGLRFLVDQKDNVNLRFDYVLGNENNSGFYISFGESF
jgi:hypothetical protein